MLLSLFFIHDGLAYRNPKTSKGRKPCYEELKEQRVREIETGIFDVNREILSDMHLQAMSLI